MLRINFQREPSAANKATYKKQRSKYLKIKKRSIKAYTLFFLFFFFCKQRSFSTQTQCCLIFSWSEFQM